MKSPFTVCKYWKKWNRKTKLTWILTALVSGADYAEDLEHERQKEATE